MEYCRGVKIKGHACSAGKIEFWKKVMNSREEQKEVLDELLVMLGGDSVVASRKWHWSSSECDFYLAWVFCAWLDASLGGVLYEGKCSCYSRLVVRPVLDLSELSL